MILIKKCDWIDAEIHGRFQCCVCTKFAHREQKENIKYLNNETDVTIKNKELQKQSNKMLLQEKSGS
jgi:hypothetical protein